MKKRYPLSIVLFFLLNIGFAQSKSTDNLDLNKMLTLIDSTNIFQLPNQYVWCNSAIRGEDKKYHLFFSQWTHGKRALDDDSLNYIFDGFKGWLKYSEIGYAVSDQLTGNYKPVKTLIKGDCDPKRWDRFTMHNPQIRQFKGKYYLYYASNSFDPNYTLANAKSDWLHWLKYNCTQKSGVLVANSMKDMVNGNFKRSDKPLISPDNVRTFEVTNNPSVCEGPDGKYYMIFKSRKPNVGNMTHWIATADKPDGPFTMVSEVFTSAEMACEDPCLWYDKKRKRFYAVVKYFSNAQKLVAQFGALALITSKDGLKWEAAAHPLVSMRELKFQNGKTVSLANLERPFVVTDKKGQAVALFAAAAEQPPGKTAGANTFSVCIPLK